MVSFLLVSPRHGEDIANAEYKDFLRASGLKPQQLTQRILDSETAEIGSLAGFDGVFVGGSPLNVTTPRYTPEQHHIHRQLGMLVDAAIPTLFICFGAGLLAQLGGGSVGHSHPETSGASLVELTSAASSDPLTHNLPSRFSVLTGHTENVMQLPETATLLASGPQCPVQMFRANPSTWACQFHTEMDSQAMETRMRFYSDYGYFSPEDFDNIIASIADVDTSSAHQIVRNFVSYCTARARAHVTTPRMDYVHATDPVTFSAS